jgi:hypothetical protein
MEERAIDRIKREGQLYRSKRTEEVMPVVVGEEVGRQAAARLRDPTGIETFGAISGRSGLRGRAKRVSCEHENAPMRADCSAAAV